MRLNSLASTGTICLAACAAAAANPQPAAAQYDAAEAQRRFDEMAANYPAINATVMVDGEIIWEAESGTLRDADDSTTRDYNIYSAAKMLTGLAFAKLGSEGDINLDTLVRTIEEKLPEHYEDVTLRQLLGHTGGVRNYRSEKDWRAFSDMRCATPQDTLGYFIEDPLISGPGEKFSYSTFGFTLLSHLLVQITGEETFDGAMENVLSEHYLAEKDSETADKAQNYVGKPGAFTPVTLSAECKFGGGGLIASARDLAAIGSALADGDIVSLDFVAEKFIANDKTGYAYGMGVGFSESLGTRYSLHSGGSPGGRAFLLVFYKPKIVVAFTSNFDGPNLSDLAIAIGRIFSGASAE